MRMHGVNWLCAAERAAGGEKPNLAQAAISARSAGAFGVGFVFSNRHFWFIVPPVREKVVSPYSRARCAPGLPMAQLFLSKPVWPFKIDKKMLSPPPFSSAGALRSANSIAQRFHQINSTQSGCVKGQGF